MERIVALVVMTLVLAPVVVLALRGTRWDVTDPEMRYERRAQRRAVRGEIPPWSTRGRGARAHGLGRGAWGDSVEADPDGPLARELSAIRAARGPGGASRPVGDAVRDVLSGRVDGSARAVPAPAVHEPARTPAPGAPADFLSTPSEVLLWSRSRGHGAVGSASRSQ